MNTKKIMKLTFLLTFTHISASSYADAEMLNIQVSALAPTYLSHALAYMSEFLTEPPPISALKPDMRDKTENSFDSWSPWECSAPHTADTPEQYKELA